MGKLGIYLVANYPTRAIFLEAVRACQDRAVDFLEVGFPFSDPVADGEVIERASLEVLRRDRLADFFEAFQQARALFTGRVYVMTSTNIVFSPGIAHFIGRLGPASGLILPDLPLRETPRFEAGLKGSGLSLIRFLTPESRPQDMALALKGARDFIYFVSKRGTTGGAFAPDGATREKIARIRAQGAAVYVGFGIQGKGDVRLAHAIADGAIIGTKAVSALGHGIDRFKEFLASL